MAWRIVCVENPAQLSSHDNKLVIKQDGKEALFPFEDIDSLVLDGHGITLTLNLMAGLVASDVNVVVCDEKHLPAGGLLAYSQHSRQSLVSREQIAMGSVLRKRIWQEIVAQKIANQAAVLYKHGYDNSELINYARNVKSGDSTNRESLAARSYFAVILGDATRRKPTWHNASLNYGYAIVRSAIAHSVASRGLIASQGIFHHSELNSFNLVDDLIECYRPAVDDYVLSVVALHHLGEEDEGLSREDRAQLVDILNQNVIMEEKKYTIKHACDKTVEGFVRAMKSENVLDLCLPSIVL